MYGLSTIRQQVQHHQDQHCMSWAMLPLPSFLVLDSLVYRAGPQLQLNTLLLNIYLKHLMLDCSTAQLVTLVTGLVFRLPVLDNTLPFSFLPEETVDQVKSWTALSSPLYTGIIHQFWVWIHSLPLSRSRSLTPASSSSSHLLPKTLQQSSPSV